MKVSVDEVLAVVDISGNNSGVAPAIANFSKNEAVIFQQSGEIRSVIFVDDAVSPKLYFTNLGARAVQKRFNSDGFIFI